MNSLVSSLKRQLVQRLITCKSANRYRLVPSGTKIFFFFGSEFRLLFPRKKDFYRQQVDCCAKNRLRKVKLIQRRLLVEGACLWEKFPVTLQNPLKLRNAPWRRKMTAAAQFLDSSEISLKFGGSSVWYFLEVVSCLEVFLSG